MRCDACGQLVEPSLAPIGRIDRSALPQYAQADSDEDELPLGSGLLVFARGDEVRYEEPPLCARCSVAIGVTALVRWAEEEEEG
jgi:hypothetical protein